MPSLDLLTPFFLATAVFACVPGPGMFYAAAQTAARGRRAGWLSAIGFHVGGYVHITAAAFGLAILLETVPILYAVVKFAGAAYLIWLGIKLLIAQKSPITPVVATEVTPHRHVLRDGFIVEVLNPKTAIFYMSFLPQFTDVSAPLPVWGQILVLGAVVNLLFSITDVACVLLSDKMTSWLVASQSISRWIRRVSGGLFVALGINLATSQQ